MQTPLQNPHILFPYEFARGYKHHDTNGVIVSSFYHPLSLFGYMKSIDEINLPMVFGTNDRSSLHE